MSRTNGRPEPEVIVNYADGFSYVKGRMEDAFRTGGILEKGPVKSQKDALGSTVKKEDIDLIVNEFEIPRTQAEKALLQHKGDISATLKALIFSS